MNFLVLLPLAFLVVPLIPTFIEIFRRKDKGPREIPEKTIYEEKPDIRSVPMLERARGAARVKAAGEVIRVVGNVSIPDRTEINNHLIVQGSLKLGKKCHVRGSIKAFGSVEVGESSIIDGHILSEGKILIGRNSRVNGVVDSIQDIILEENAFVEAVSTEKTVKLGSGAKVNKRVLSGTSIITAPTEEQLVPTVQGKAQIPKIVEKEKPRIREVKPPTLKVVPAIPSFKLPQLKESEKKTKKITDRIFEFLEDRIREFDKIEGESIEGVRLEDLTETEIEVFRLACESQSLEEISLRLLMDPLEVQEVLNGLIEKGYLDEDLKPKRRERRKELEISTHETTKESETPQPTPAEEETKEEIEASVGESEFGLSLEEIFERLLASKMRKELKSRIRVEIEESKEDEEAVDKEEMKGILKEWEKASSLLWETEEKEDRHDSSSSHSAEYVERTEKLVEKDETVKEEDGEKATRGLRKIKKESFTSKHPLKFPDAMFRRFGFLKVVGILKSIIPSSVGSKNVIFLPFLALITLLSAEIAYYSSSLVVFLDSTLPFNLRVWFILLILALGLSLTSGLYAWKYSNQQEKPNETSRGKVYSD